MARMKQSARKHVHGLPQAKFPTSSPEETDWTQLNPTIPGSASPVLQKAVERANSEFDNSPPQNDEELVALAQDLYFHPPTPSP
ncbi:MAG: hypothetical protein MJE68_24275, partial [Proteobacteria bacterium]|nr:hypothetical protein [Pseudomonadota bacterium]